MYKLRADLSILSGATGETSSGLTGGKIESVTPEKRIYLAMSPPRKDPIPNQDKNI